MLRKEHFNSLESYGTEALRNQLRRRVIYKTYYISILFLRLPRHVTKSLWWNLMKKILEI